MWLYLPREYYPSAREYQDSTLDVKSPVPEAVLCVTSNGKPLLRPFSWQGWRTRPWMKHLSGTMLEPSTAQRGVERLIASLPDSPASPSVRRESNSGRGTRDGSGRMYDGSFTRYDPLTSSWRTYRDSFQRTLDGNLEPFSGPWPNSGMMLSGMCFPLRKLDRPTSDDESSYWRSPNQHEPGIDSERLEGEPGHRMYDRETGRLAQVGITQQAIMWGTPASRDWKDGNPSKKVPTDSRLGWQAPRITEAWPTPRAEERAKCYARGNLTLRESAQTWPTPRSSEKGDYQRTKDGREIRTLTGASKDSHTGLLPPGTAQDGPPSSGSGPTSPLQLNPAFVEWLMGFPPRYTLPDTGLIGYDAWETQSCRLLARLLSSRYGGG